MTTPSADTHAPALLPRTEERHPDTMDLDTMTSLQIVSAMNREDRSATDAVAAILPDLAALVDEAAARIKRGGAVHYFGAGTSGRLGVLDAAELVPTFNLASGIVVAHIAGDERAIVHAVEGSEDSALDGAAAADGLGPDDLAIGLAASGGTPYVGGALAAARERGAATALMTSNPSAAHAPLADHLLVADTGPEILTGSTRLKAGTALKTMLNAFSTALMVRSGYTWSNLMVSMVASNAKLRDRATRIVSVAAELSTDRSAELIAASNGDLKVALIAALTGIDVDAARAALTSSRGNLRNALSRLDTHTTHTHTKEQK